MNSAIDFKDKVNKLISEQNFSEAINVLQNVLQNDSENIQAKVLLEQVQKINQYHIRDIYGATNLDMDPWFE
ncbi:MAG: hypothetical protein RBR30_11655 [Tenuifilaceae bacterium]|nr:hypothetical protein [Tenuifilaceae bacterium]